MIFFKVHDREIFSSEKYRINEHVRNAPHKAVVEYKPTQSCQELLTQISPSQEKIKLNKHLYDYLLYAIFLFIN